MKLVKVFLVSIFFFLNALSQEEEGITEDIPIQEDKQVKKDIKDINIKEDEQDKEDIQEDIHVKKDVQMQEDASEPDTSVEVYEYSTTDGFNQNQPQNSVANRIIVTGVVKNIAGEKLGKIIIKTKFFDSNNNYLDEFSYYCWDVANSYTDDFNIIYSGQYVEDVDSLKFEFSTST